MNNFFITLPDNSYPVIIGNNLPIRDILPQYVSGQQILIVTNQTIAPLYLSALQEALTQYQCDTLILPDGENFKNFSSLSLIYDTLVKLNHHRTTTLIALGGGVIGDITGFAASTYQRGVNFIQLPTTLLAQVDASIGGKTAINHPLGKNMIGSFYQPKAVIIDPIFLNTLPERQLRAGFGEIIKYALLQGGDLFDHVLAITGNTELKDIHWEELITWCCQIKGSYVEQDEKENNNRALLNLGHTFAHALETYTQYQCFLHGEAVGIGLYCAALLSQRVGRLDANYSLQISGMLTALKLPNRIPQTIDIQKLYDLFQHDKKMLNNKLRFVLIERPGLCYLDDALEKKDIIDVLMEAVEGD
jgi:3-dehydroquinate synthase